MKEQSHGPGTRAHRSHPPHVRDRRRRPLPALVAPDADITDPFTTVYGPEGFAELARGFAGAFSERRLDVLDVVESGDAAVAQVRVSARHTGALALELEEIGPTGNDIGFEEAGVVRVRDGRIASWHSYYDAGELARQLEPAAAADPAG